MGMLLFHLCLGETKKMQHPIQFSETIPDNVYKKTFSTIQPTGSVRSGIPEIDETIGGLRIGQITAFIGKSNLLSNLLHRVCMNTFDMFHSPTIVLDGGNQLNPFLLARFARLNMISHQELLQQVYLSRAYTAYQLNDLIHFHVESLIQQKKPVTLILTGLCSLLGDADISDEMASHLLQLLMKKMKKITQTYPVAILIIDKQDLRYDEEFDELADTIVHVKDMCHCPRITIIQRNQQITVTSETFGQLCLQDFGMVI
jgi:hypothetical protein